MSGAGGSWSVRGASVARVLFEDAHVWAVRVVERFVATSVYLRGSCIWAGTQGRCWSGHYYYWRGGHRAPMSSTHRGAREVMGKMLHGPVVVGGDRQTCRGRGCP